MANTERLAVIRMIREAKHVAQNVRYDATLSMDVRIKIEDIFVDLDRLEDDLILAEIEDKVAALEKAGRRLTKVADDVKKEDEKLAALCGKIEKAAKGLSALADIASKAAGFV